jgi:calcineurin-like phosphoesterase family protein
MDNSKTFVTSDFHFNHNNILSYERSGFKDINDHNETIIRLYNETVGENDKCYILGDVGFGSIDKLRELIHRLNGHKILIFGNHDKFTVSAAISMGFDRAMQGPYFCPEGKGHIVLSHFPVRDALDNPYEINVHGHLHSSKLNLPHYYNVNVALTDYKPVDIHTFVDELDRLGIKSRREDFHDEWYKDHVVKADGSWKGHDR